MNSLVEYNWLNFYTQDNTNKSYNKYLQRKKYTHQISLT